MSSAERLLILLVEDDPDVALVTSTRLRVSGFTVAVATDGYTALSMAAEMHPALILVDLKIPGISGQELVRLIRADSRFGSVPVVIFTASSSNNVDLQQLCCDIGANDYVRKPYTPDDLIQKIRSLILQRERTEVSD